MFRFLCGLGPAAITFLTVRKCTDSAPTNWYTSCIDLVAYAALDMAILILLLEPCGKVEIIVMSNGFKNIQYGGTAFLLSIPVAIVSGIVLSVIKKGIEIKVKVMARKKDWENGDEK